MPTTIPTTNDFDSNDFGCKAGKIGVNWANVDCQAIIDCLDTSGDGNLDALGVDAAALANLCTEVLSCLDTSGDGQIDALTIDASNVTNLPAEIFLASASYDQTTNEITMTLTDGSTVVVDVTDLIDVVSVEGADSDCISTVVTGAGSPTDPFVVTVSPILDPDATNLLTCTTNGLGVIGSSPAFQQNVEDALDADGDGIIDSLGVDPANITGFCAAVVGCLDTNGDGELDVLTAPTDCAAVLACLDTNGDGELDALTVPAPTITDNGNFTLTGNVLTHTNSDGTTQPVDLSPILSSGGGTITATGTDTNCIDITVSGNGASATPLNVSASPILDPATSNLLECTSNGMRVDTAAVLSAIETETFDCTGLPTLT